MESDDMIYQAVGETIRASREKARLTQEELAAKVHLTRTSITNIEKGRQRIQVHTLCVIAAALRVSPQSLLPDDADRQGQEIARVLEQHPQDVRSWVSELVPPRKEGLGYDAQQEPAQDSRDRRGPTERDR